MGSPFVWYRHILANFVAELNLETDQAKLSMMSERQLKQLITENKDRFSEKEYYFNAGVAAEKTLNQTNNIGVDALNASFGGLSEFYHFIDLDDKDGIPW